MAIQEVRPAPAQDAGVRVEAARSLFGSRMPSLRTRVEPCLPDPVTLLAPVEGIVLPDLREHPWPTPTLAAAADILASGAEPERFAGTALPDAGELLAEIGHPIVPPRLRPEPWPAPPAVRAWMAPDRIAHIEPRPPTLVAVRAPREVLVAAPLAPVPWPEPEESAGHAVGRCPTA
jgi:hypothetical protein